MSIKDKSKIRMLIFFLLPFTVGYLFSGERETFSEGCNYYRNGQYEKALEQFKLLENGTPTANLFYNIGNTYFRLGKIGLSLLYYERARKISPNDEDINSNIKYLSGLINDPDYEQSFITRLDNAVVKLVFSIALFIFTITISVKLFIPQKKMLWYILISFLFFITCSVFYYFSYQQQKQIKAVVTSNAEIRSGPDNNFKVNFTLPEGKKVTILEKSDGWSEVGVESMGIRGWLETKFIEII